MKFRVFVALITVSLSVFALAVDIDRGTLDDRIYHYEVLDNQLKVLLISDPDTDKAAASMDVNVGSYDDPKDREGLAHFLEHMLFLGTQKYPEADEYQNFISDHGGSHNAFTSSHHTNYFFDIDTSQLEPALDRFAQFFIAPLFDSFYIDRERNAVHSEYQASIRDDFRRGYDVYRNVINPNHPDAKFNVGSLSTLADRPSDPVKDDLLAFYQQHYSSHKMALVVIGKEPIAELRKMVVQRFAPIPLVEAAKSPEAIKATKKESIFLEGSLPLEAVIRPISEVRQMSLTFFLPSSLPYYREKPLNYIAHLIGHEGRGSLLSLLKREGLAESISAGSRDKEDGTSAFSILISLTEKGVEKRALVRSLVFYMLEQIKAKGIEQWRYDESRLLAETAFRFREKPTPFHTVTHLSGNLHRYPPSDVISGDYLLVRYDEELIHSYLEQMTPGAVYVSTVFPEATTTKVTPYYRVPFDVNALSKTPLKLDASITKRLHLPEANPFIPQDLSLFEKAPTLTEPSTLVEADTVLFWAKQELTYGTPKVKVLLRITSPEIAEDVKGNVLNALYVDLIQDRLNEFSYPAYLAGALVDLKATNRGVDITLEGYHDKLNELMALLLSELDKVSIDKSRYQRIKSELQRNWSNTDKRTPYRQLYNQLAVNLYHPFWAAKEKLEILEKVTLRDVKRFAGRWRQGAKVVGLFYGNIDKELVDEWQVAAQQLVTPAPSDDLLEINPIRVVKLINENAVQQVLEVDHNDQAAILYVQGQDDSLEDKAKMMVLRQIMQSPFYSSLRTEQQLGYVVFMGSLSLKEVPGSVFVVQSPSASVLSIKQAIELFIKAYESQLPADIEKYKQAVVTQLSESPTSLSTSANVYWQNIIKGNERFDYRQQLIAAVKSVTIEDIRHYYKAVLIHPGRSLWQFSEAIEKTPLPVFSDEEQAFYQYH